MPINRESDSNIYHIKLQETNKTKIYVDDTRSKKAYKPSTKSLYALENLLKRKHQLMLIRYFLNWIIQLYLILKWVDCYPCITLPNLTSLISYIILQSISSDIGNHSWYLQLMLWKALNKSAFEANLPPTNMFEHDNPSTVLK